MGKNIGIAAGGSVFSAVKAAPGNKKGRIGGKKSVLLALLALGGALLLLLGSGVGGAGSGGTSQSVQTDAGRSLEDYAKQLRREIAELCDSVGGVSDVTVAVSFEHGFEYVYAADTRADYGSGGQVKYVTVGNGSSERTVYLTERLPGISGIGIVCRGGDDPEIVRHLTALLSAAYNIGSNKIYVTGR